MIKKPIRISMPDKYNLLYKKALNLNKEQIIKDKEFLIFFCWIRNMIQSNFTYKGNEVRILKTENFILKLEPGKAMGIESLNENFVKTEMIYLQLVIELLKVYKRLVSSLPISAD